MRPSRPSVAIRVGLCLLGFLCRTRAQGDRMDWEQARELYPEIRHARLEVATPRPMRLNFIRVDRTHPRIRFHTTSRDARWGDPMPSDPSHTIRTRRQTTRQYIETHRAVGTPMVVAVNASFWSPSSQASGQAQDYADYLGLTISDGMLVDVRRARRATLFFTRDGQVGMRHFPRDADLSEIVLAVSGGEFVLIDGEPTGGGSPEPRTGYGLCREARYLFFLTIDGRQPEDSEGATTRELGAWLLHAGAWTGINMDGGGSTTLAWWNPDASLGRGKSVLLNSPSDRIFGLLGVERRVGNHLGVSYADD